MYKLVLYDIKIILQANATGYRTDMNLNVHFIHLTSL